VASLSLSLSLSHFLFLAQSVSLSVFLFLCALCQAWEQRKEWQTGLPKFPVI